MKGLSHEVLRYWRNRSLKFWLAMGMIFTILPMFLSSTIGYTLYHKKIIEPLVEVSSQQRAILQPLQTIQISLWDLSETVIDYSVDGQQSRKTEFQQEKLLIDTAFEQILNAVKQNPLELKHTLNAKDDWQKVSELSELILSEDIIQEITPLGQETIDFEANINQLNHDLELIYTDVRLEAEQNHKLAISSLKTYETLILIAFIISLAFAGLGIYIINQSLVSSMNKLASGAVRLAQGEDHNNIEVSYPSELVKVADAFNVMIKNITEKEAALVQASRTDELTGLYNRREFNRLIAQELERSQRYSHPLSIIVIDIDYFKKINDDFGHLVGDQALIQVAKIIQEQVRDIDKVCRFGGEEFVVILPESGSEETFNAAERIRKTIESTKLVLDTQSEVSITISLGIASYPSTGEEVSVLVNNADTALYQSKSRGRNQTSTA